MLQITLFAALIGAVGCPRREALWVAEGSTASNLTFVVGERTGVESQLRIYSLRVEHCASGDSVQPEQLWAIAEAQGAASATPSRVRYGETPAGFVQKVPPKVLALGCYIARLGGSGVSRFEVDSTGRVTESR